ncbi:SCO6745 family protein [Pseudonocardia sp. RS010]|uniref:SCO6745 family protein n=1 Tax=Pseudonocardia sp. RS010 TaxID=3385979 RepID=UPI0039A303EC
MDRAARERELWRVIEAVHAVVYFAPDPADRLTALGLRGFWRRYFAARAAALGPVPAAVVTALFHGFAPRMVERAVPAVWEIARPGAVTEARTAGAAAALARLRPDGWDPGPALALLAAARPPSFGGRALAAAHAAVPEPADDLARLWHAATVLREYRGDGHVAALVAAGVDGAGANVLLAALGSLVDQQREFRGWTTGEWTAAGAALRLRGWLDADGAVTPRGREARVVIEHCTDDAAAPAFAGLDDAALVHLLDALAPLAAAVVDTGAVPYPNAMGVAAPAALR